MSQVHNKDDRHSSTVKALLEVVAGIVCWVGIVLLLLGMMCEPVTPKTTIDLQWDELNCVDIIKMTPDLRMNAAELYAEENTQRRR